MVFKILNYSKLEKIIGGALGNNLVRVRHSVGLTQEVLAFNLNISQSSISKYEKGVETPSIDFITDFVKFTGVSFEEVLLEEYD